MEVERPGAGPFVVGAFKTPAGVDLLFGVEVVVDLNVDLLANIGRADTESVIGSLQRLKPSRPARIQPIADVAVVDDRHDAEEFRNVAGCV